jgi:hypothetical protein
MALLVAFDWEYALVVAWVVVMIYCLLKGLVQVLEPVLKNIVETD